MESRLPLVPLENCWPLVSLVSRRHVLSAGTCPLSARVLSAHTPTTICALGAAGSLSSTSSRLSLRRHVFSSAHTDSLSPRTQARRVLTAPVAFPLSLTWWRLSLRRHVFSSAHTDSLSPRTQTLSLRRFHTLSHSLSPSPSALSRAPPPSALARAPPPSGRRILSPPIGGGHASFPRHRDRWVFTPGEIAAVCFFCTQPP